MKKVVLALLPSVFALFATTVVFAQTKVSPPAVAGKPTIILTWQAHSYIPAGYPGKILPLRESLVDVYLEFMDGGKIIPLATTVVRWEINGIFLAGGPNLNRISFPLDRFTTRTYEVTATIKDYKGQDINKTILINRVDPLVVLRATALQKDASGTRVNLTATPYFFSSPNLNDYLFSWLVNGLEGETVAPNLDVAIPKASGQQTLSVEVAAANRNNEIESADARMRFIISN